MVAVVDRLGDSKDQVSLGYREPVSSYRLHLTMPSTDISSILSYLEGGHCGRDHMVVGFITTYAISVYHKLTL